MENTLQLLPTISDLPIPAMHGVEPLLTLDEVCAWTRYSKSSINNYRRRATDPLPQVGTIGAPRFLPSEVLAWMRREYANATAAAEAQ